MSSLCGASGLKRWPSVRSTGGFSRWNVKKDLSWTPLRAERVCEVSFSQLQGNRFRHSAHFLRWRHDRSPDSCTYDQLEVATPLDFAHLFA